MKRQVTNEGERDIIEKKLKKLRDRYTRDCGRNQQAQGTDHMWRGRSVKEKGTIDDSWKIKNKAVRRGLIMDTHLWGRKDPNQITL